MGCNPAALISGPAVGLVVSSTVELRRRAAPILVAAVTAKPAALQA
ncbi:MAG: hypothetical protein ACLP81_04985 [Acidimicrobiales bacterium]